MIEPFVFWSKYRIGSVCMWANISSRTRLRTPCPITTIIRLYIKVEMTPHRKMIPRIVSAVYSSV